MNMFYWNITSMRFQTYIIEKLLGQTEDYEHVSLEHYISNVSNI